MNYGADWHRHHSAPPDPPKEQCSNCDEWYFEDELVEVNNDDYPGLYCETCADDLQEECPVYTGEDCDYE